jgi:protein TonB
MYYLEAGYGKHNRLRNAIVAALLLHLGLIMAVSFEQGGQQSYSPQIAVTLATRPNTEAPEEARHFAQSNQSGSGDQSDRDLMTSRDAAIPDSIPAPHRAPPRREQNLEQPQAELVKTAAASRLVAPDSMTEKELRELPLEGISPEVDELARQLASLEAELDRQTQSYSSMPRVRRLTSISAKQAVDAAYLLDWRQRVEAVGNKYYPEASVRYGIYGSLRLLVVIRNDGSLEDIRVLSSSGHAVLDEAAIKIVRMAAPYSPFPPELKATTDKLEIIRTWQFQENQLSSG